MILLDLMKSSEVRKAGDRKVELLNCLSQEINNTLTKGQEVMRKHWHCSILLMKQQK